MTAKRGLLFSLLIATFACAPAQPSIVRAAIGGDVSKVEQLLRAGADPNACARPDGGSETSPLTGAAANGRADVVRALIRAGAVVDKPCGVGPAMHYAVANGKVEVVEVLLASGADAAAGAGVGRTYLMEAAIWVHPEVIPMLVRAGCPLEATRPVVREAIDDREGVTALMIAAGWDPRPTRALIDAGANVNARDAMGATPLIHAVKGAVWTAQNGPTKPGKWDPSIVRMLLDAGADPRVADASGQTAWALAKDAGPHAPAIRAILEKYSGKIGDVGLGANVAHIVT